MRPRTHILQMKTYTAETTVNKLAEMIGMSPEEIIKAEFNESPYPPSPKVLQALYNFVTTNKSMYGKMNYYPYDIQYKDVRGKLANAIDPSFSAKNTLLGNGSNEIIDLTIKTFVDSNEEALLMKPVFGGYEVYLNTYRIKTHDIICDDDLVFNIEGIEKGITGKTKLVFVVHPNNPTGIMFSREHLISLLKKYSGVMFFVDEAYIDIAPKGSSFIGLTKEYDNLIIARTCSKAYGLAGARIGYAVSSEGNIEWMSKARVSYTANIFSVIALDALLEDGEFLDGTIAKIISERERMIDKIRELDIVSRVYNSQANFVLVRFKEQAKEIHRHLLNNGIITRDYTRAPKLENCLRITVCDKERNSRILDVLSEYNG